MCRFAAFAPLLGQVMERPAGRLSSSHCLHQERENPVFLCCVHTAVVILQEGGLCAEQ